MTPMTRANAKLRITSPPRTKRDKTVRKVVPEVITVRLKVSLTLWLISSARVVFITQKVNW